MYELLEKGMRHNFKVARKLDVFVVEYFKKSHPIEVFSSSHSSVPIIDPSILKIYLQRHRCYILKIPMMRSSKYHKMDTFFMRESLSFEMGRESRNSRP